jgi:hypothetical protein
MLTVLAWLTFVPAVAWNFLLFIIVFAEIMGNGQLNWSARNVRDLILSLAVLLIPGVYLFGWF